MQNISTTLNRGELKQHSGKNGAPAAYPFLKKGVRTPKTLKKGMGMDRLEGYKQN